MDYWTQASVYFQWKASFKRHVYSQVSLNTQVRRNVYPPYFRPLLIKYT